MSRNAKSQPKEGMSLKRRLLIQILPMACIIYAAVMLIPRMVTAEEAVAVDKPGWIKSKFTEFVARQDDDMDARFIALEERERRMAATQEENLAQASMNSQNRQQLVAAAASLAREALAFMEVANATVEVANATVPTES